MDDWLSTLIGTALIGGAIYIVGKEGQKQGYNQAVNHMNQNRQDQEIANLRAELNALKATKNPEELGWKR